ncbi:MAG: M28 family peptidase, partial [bacterium]
MMTRDGKTDGKPDVPYDRVSRDRLMADVEAIAGWVRLSGTPEELAAFKYAQRQLRASGCRTQLLTHDAYISLPGPASLVVTSAGGERRDIPCVTHSFAMSTPPEGLDAPAIYAGSGAPADAAADMVGRIVVIDGLARPDRVRSAQAAGAAGLVFLNRDPFVHEMIVSTVWGSPPADALHRMPRVPVVSVAGRDADGVRDLARTDRARMRITAAVDTAWRKTPVLVGDLPGAGEETFVLFSGHLDSWHRGAMDNGTANATMLEVARVMRRVRRYRGIRFAFWSGHSHGRYSGSTWYADNYWDDLDARCVAHVNVDSVGARGAVINPHAYAMPETRGVADAVIRSQAGVRFDGARVGRMGDQSFLGIGVPSLLMDLSDQPGDSPQASRDFSMFTGGTTGGLGWWWHTTEDLPDKIDPALLERDCRIYLGIIHAFATSRVLPLDYAATAREWMQRLAGYRRALGRRVDLRPTIAAAARLTSAAMALERQARALRRTADRRAVRALNEALIAVGRALIPVDYTQAGRFHPDPAVTPPDPPHLAALRALATASGDA